MPLLTRLYGLTGGIGSGKSEVARRLAERGVPVLDADRIGHEAIAPGGAAEHAVAEAFGDAVLTNGRIDRGRLGAVVFADRDALARLNALVHPAIHREVARRAKALARAGHAFAILEAALLAEDGRKDPCLAGLIVVVCPEALRLRRLVELRGLTPEDARRRMASQASPDLKLALADHLIHNDGTLAELWARVDALVEELRRDEG